MAMHTAASAIPSPFMPNLASARSSGESSSSSGAVLPLRCSTPYFSADCTRISSTERPKTSEILLSISLFSGTTDCSHRCTDDFETYIFSASSRMESPRPSRSSFKYLPSILFISLLYHPPHKLKINCAHFFAFFIYFCAARRDTFGTEFAV